MCSELIVPIPLQTIPFLVLAVVAQYSASPSTNQSGQLLGRGCTPMLERIWWHPRVRRSAASRVLQPWARRMSVGRASVKEDVIREKLVVRLDVGSTVCGRGSRFRSRRSRRPGETPTREPGSRCGQKPQPGPDTSLQQPAAVLGERLGGLVEDQVMIRFKELVPLVGPLVRRFPNVGPRERLKRLVSRYQHVGMPS